MAITPTVVNGEDAVRAAYRTFSQKVDNSMNLCATDRSYVLIPAMIKILKEWTIGFLASRILGGQFPSQGEVIDISHMTADSPEAVLLFSMSGLYSTPNAIVSPTLEEWCQGIGKNGVQFFETWVISPTLAQVLNWKNDFLRSVLLYTICHVLTSSLIFPDYAYSDPVDTSLGVRTLLLAKTGAYMHFYGLRSAREYINSFRMMLDSPQHVSVFTLGAVSKAYIHRSTQPTGMAAYDMALDIQKNKEESRTDCYIRKKGFIPRTACILSGKIN
jgi:hypothetical protein